MDEWWSGMIEGIVECMVVLLYLHDSAPLSLSSLALM
jgi:hypothetical protein